MTRLLYSGIFIWANCRRARSKLRVPAKGKAPVAWRARAGGQTGADIEEIDGTNARATQRIPADVLGTRRSALRHGHEYACVSSGGEHFPLGQARKCDARRRPSGAEEALGDDVGRTDSAGTGSTPTQISDTSAQVIVAL